MSIQEKFIQFLKAQWHEGKLLLALSGGPDSMALFRLLLAERIPFEVAHVDHGWRAESGAEASQLAQKCEDEGVPFHLKRLAKLTGNLEDASRQARLSFFRELCEREGFEAVLLGHHRDDRAETVLKRVLEGASLPKLKGLTRVAYVEGVTLWRPLLGVSKTEILEWLQEGYFEDRTNADTQFLRARMREHLIPYLNESFQKNVSGSLCRLADAAEELEEHVDLLVAPFLKRMEGGVLDLSHEPPQSRFLWKEVVRAFFRNQKITVSHTVLETIVGHLKKSSRRTYIKVGARWVVIDRGTVKLCVDGECTNRV